MITRLFLRWLNRVDPAWHASQTRLTQPGDYSFERYVAQKRAAEARETKRRQLSDSGGTSTQPGGRVETFRRKA